jgi:GNAT superfamily N-acetyltransferase
MAVRIKEVNGKHPKTAELLRELQLECLPGDVVVDPREGHWWVAYEGDRPVAFLGLVPSYLWINWGYLSRVGVRASHRGQGLQLRLTRVCERKARKLGWAGVESNTYENPPSSNNFIKAGYRIHAPAVRYFADGTTHWFKTL